MSTPQTHAPPKPPPTADGVEAVRKALGDPEVLRNLTTQALAKAGYKNAIQADDLVQEACQRAWEKAATFDPTRGGAAGWIQGFLRNVFREQCRQQAKFSTAGHDFGEYQDVKADAEWDVDYAEIRFRIQRYYDRLPKDFQAVIKMKFYEDLDGQTAAKRLDISYDLYRTRLTRAVKMLRDLAGVDAKGGRS